MQTTKRKWVWVNGCFDVLHRGHIELFLYAARLGVCLIVGIDSDRRVKESKGPTRPIQSQEDRKCLLENLQMIDEVVIFDSDEELRANLVKYNIDCLVVGGDWKGKQIVGQELVKEVFYFDRIPDYSTTKIIGDK